MAKKVIAIVSLVIIGLLIGATIVLANVNVDYGINCAAPEIIRVLKPGAKDANSTSDQQFKEIKKLVSNASKTSCLSAIFDGTLFDEVSIVEDKTTEINKKSDCYYVQYVYSTNPQTLKEGNKNYKVDGSNYLYKELWFEISNVRGVNEFNVYVVPTDKLSTYSSMHYVVKADYSALYNYLVENFK